MLNNDMVPIPGISPGSPDRYSYVVMPFPITGLVHLCKNLVPVLSAAVLLYWMHPKWHAGHPCGRVIMGTGTGLLCLFNFFFHGLFLLLIHHIPFQ